MLVLTDSGLLLLDSCGENRLQCARLSTLDDAVLQAVKLEVQKARCFQRYDVADPFAPVTTDVQKDLTGIKTGIQDVDAQSGFICTIDDTRRFRISGKNASVLEVIIRHSVQNYRYYNIGKDPNTEPLHHVRFRAWETSERSLPFSVDGVITDGEPKISGDDAVIVKLIINNIIELEKFRESCGCPPRDFEDQIDITRPYPTYCK